MNTNAIIMIFHAVMAYGIIFWGNSYHSIKYLECKKKHLGLLWGEVTENLVETYSKN